MNATSLAWKISKVLLACQIVVTSVASSFTTPAPVFQYGHQVRTSTTTRRSNNDGTVTQLCAISRNPLLLSFLSKPSPPSPPPSPAAVIQQQVTEFAKHSSIIGQLKSIITKFVMTPTKTKMILKSISHAIQYEELFFFAFMGWAFVPLLGLPQTVVRDFLIQKGVGGGRQRIRSFKRSNTKLIADQIAGISRIGFIVYITDILKLLLLALGFKHPQLKNMPNIVAKSLITWWVVNRLAALKRYILAMETRNNPGDLVGSVELVNHLIDAFLYGFGAYVLIDHLQTNFSAATTSLAAFGGVSTLVVSLASQGLITQVFYGLFLAASNKIRKGEVAEFGDGAVSGLVASIGWTDTLVRGGDGVLVSVPNRELADKPIRNLSRISISSVEQELRFKYSDAEKIPKLLEDIKEEIKEACPDLITDGSRPFRCYWTDYGKTGLEVSIKAHFRIKLLGEAYHENRQNMLMAINRAVKNNKVEFSTLDEKLLNALYKSK